MEEDLKFNSELRSKFENEIKSWIDNLPEKINEEKNKLSSSTEAYEFQQIEFIKNELSFFLNNIFKLNLNEWQDINHTITVFFDVFIKLLINTTSNNGKKPIISFETLYESINEELLKIKEMPINPDINHNNNRNNSDYLNPELLNLINIPFQISKWTFSHINYCIKNNLISIDWINQKVWKDYYEDIPFSNDRLELIFEVRKMLFIVKMKENQANRLKKLGFNI